MKPSGEFDQNPLCRSIIFAVTFVKRDAMP